MKLTELYQDLKKSKFLAKLIDSLHNSMGTTLPSMYSGIEVIRESLNNHKFISGNDLMKMIKETYNDEEAIVCLLRDTLDPIISDNNIYITIADIYNKYEVWVIRLDIPLSDEYRDGYILRHFRCVNIEPDSEKVNTNHVAVLILGDEYETDDDIFNVILDVYPNIYLNYLDMCSDTLSTIITRLDEQTDDMFTELITTCLSIFVKDGKNVIKRALKLIDNIMAKNIDETVLDDFVNNIK